MEVLKEKVKFQKYPTYKNSEVEWLGEIPENWKEVKLKYLAEVKKGILPKILVSEPADNLPPYLSMDYLRGATPEVWVRDKDAIIVEDNELLLLWDGSNAGEFIKSRKGVISSTVAHISFSGIDENFAKFYCHIIERHLRNNTIGMGIPHVNSKILNNSTVLIPSKQEQTAIASFLDEKCGKIDTAIDQKQKLIELLKERKQIIIQNAVTKGLDSNVKMKDSALEWIGEIPKHWEVKKAKFLFDEIDERSKNGEEELLSVSHMTGVTPRSEKEVNMFLSESYAGSKLCKKEDLVFNIMWAWMGALGVSKYSGIVSPSYSIFRQKTSNTFNPKFLEELLKSTKYIEYYNQVSTGLHSSRLRFYSRMFFDMKLAFPEKEEQDKIVNQIHIKSSKIDKAVDFQQQQIEKLKEYKSSLIDAAVTGKIKVS